MVGRFIRPALRTRAGDTEGELTRAGEMGVDCKNVKRLTSGWSPTDLDTILVRILCLYRSQMLVGR